MKPNMRLRKVNPDKMPNNVPFIMVWGDRATGGVWTENVMKIDGVLHAYDHNSDSIQDGWTTDSPYLSDVFTHICYRRY